MGIPTRFDVQPARSTTDREARQDHLSGGGDGYGRLPSC